jgi:hypothetical protein
MPSAPNHEVEAADRAVVECDLDRVVALGERSDRCFVLDLAAVELA